MIDRFFINNWFWSLNSLYLNRLSSFCWIWKRDFLLVSCFSWSWSSDGLNFWCFNLYCFDFSGYRFYLNIFLSCRFNWLSLNWCFFSIIFFFGWSWLCFRSFFWFFFITIFFMMMMLFFVWFTWRIRATWRVRIVMSVFLMVVLSLFVVSMFFVFWQGFGSRCGGGSGGCGSCGFCFLWDEISWRWNVKTNWDRWVSVWSFDGFSWTSFNWKSWNWNWISFNLSNWCWFLNFGIFNWSNITLNIC